MKLYGFSQMPNISQYLHIGYLSSTTPPQPEGKQPGYVKGGLISFLIGVGIALIAWQRSRVMFIFGLAASLAGLLVIAFAPAQQLEWGEFKFDHPEKMTEMQLIGRIAYRIGKHVVANDPIPTDIRVMQKEWRLKESEIQDAWFRDYMIEKNSNGGYTIISAAKDGVFGTKDDIKMKIETDGSRSHLRGEPDAR